eukprot:9666137-Prorocentrum_lima.AAC.1
MIAARHEDINVLKERIAELTKRMDQMESHSTTASYTEDTPPTKNFRAASVDTGRDRITNDQPVICLVGFPRDSKRKDLEKWADAKLESTGAK